VIQSQSQEVPANRGVIRPGLQRWSLFGWPGGHLPV